MLNTNLRMLQQAPRAGTGMHPTLYPDAYLVLLTSPAMFVWLEIYAYIYPDAASSYSQRPLEIEIHSRTYIASTP